ncbi:MAG TPA: site-specific integrase, partial [Candidatus Omnitrophica bacterium]|nr:site-specific integrase [Candidatus Omnitrophota bacterium]
EWVKPSRRPRTYQSYEQMIRCHVLPSPLAGKLLTQLTPQQLQAFFNEKRRAEDKPGLSPRSVEYLHAIVRKALNHALSLGLVGRNVALLVELPRAVYDEVTPLTPAQAQAFLDVASGHRLYAVYAVAVAMGLRQGEALGLRWEDVDLEAGELVVRKQLQRIEGKLRLVEVKTARSRRQVSLPSVAVAALREHRTRQKVERVRAGDLWEDTGLVFTTEIGTALDKGNLTRGFKCLLKQAGLPDVRFHDLRHTCASLLRAQGLDHRLIMETLGHSQIGITMSLYSHIYPAARREAADKIDEILH